MSDFGLFESDDLTQREPRAQARTASLKLEAAIDQVRRDFGRFLMGATGIDEFGDRWHLSKNDIRKTVEAHVFPNTGTMRRIHNAMKADWKLAHPYKVALSHEEAGFGSMPTEDTHRNLDTDETYHPSSGNLVPEGDFAGYKDGVDQDGPAKVQNAFTPGGDSGSDRHASRRVANPTKGFAQHLMAQGIDPNSLLDDQENLNDHLADYINGHPDLSDEAAIDHYDQIAKRLSTHGFDDDLPPRPGPEESYGHGDIRNPSKEAAALVADIYTDFAQANGLRVASLNTLNIYAETGIADADYRLLESMIVRQAECDEDCDEDADSEAPSESESDESGSGDDEGEDYDFGGEDDAEGDDGESEDDEDDYGFGDDADGDGDHDDADHHGGETFTVPDHAPELSPEMMGEIPQDDPGGSAPVPPEVIDSLLGLPEGTIEQLLLEEVEQGGQGGDPGMSGPPMPQGGGDDFFGGGGDDAEPPRTARRHQGAFGEEDMTDEEMWGEYERQREDAIREHQTRQHPSGVNIHTFDSTGEAYDKSQYLDEIKHGDILSVPSEKAIAVLDEAWPIPLTHGVGGAFGEFKSDDHRAGWHARNRDAMGGSIAAAQDEAARIGVPLHPVFGGGRQARRRSLARQFWAADDESSSSESESSGGGGQAAPPQDPAAAMGGDPNAMMGGGQMMPPPGSQAVQPPQPPAPIEDQPAEDALLDTANQAIMQMIDRETQEYQQIIDPLSQALQAIQFAQQVEQAEHPMDVTPPQGTVDVSPSAAPGGQPPMQQQASRRRRASGPDRKGPWTDITYHQGDDYNEIMDMGPEEMFHHLRQWDYGDDDNVRDEAPWGTNDRLYSFTDGDLEYVLSHGDNGAGLVRRPINRQSRRQAKGQGPEVSQPWEDSWDHMEPSVKVPPGTAPEEALALARERRRQKVEGALHNARTASDYRDYFGYGPDDNELARGKRELERNPHLERKPPKEVPYFNYGEDFWKGLEWEGPDYWNKGRQAKVEFGIRNAAKLIADRYRLSATGHQMLLNAALGRRGYEHVVEALRLVPPESRKAAAIHMGHLFAAGNSRFNKDIFLKTVMASNPRDRAGDAWRDGRDRGIAEHGRQDMDDYDDDDPDYSGYTTRPKSHARPGWDDREYDSYSGSGDPEGRGGPVGYSGGPDTPSGRRIEHGPIHHTHSDPGWRPTYDDVAGDPRFSSRGRLPFDRPRRTAGETWVNTPTKDAFEFPNAGQTPRVDDNIDINDLPVMKGADPHGKNAASQKAVDRFQRWQERQRRMGLPTTEGESAVHNFLQTTNPTKKRVGPNAQNMIHEHLGLQPDAVKTPKPKVPKAVNPTLKGKGGKTPAAPKAKAPAPKAAPKAPKAAQRTASFFTRKVPGWRWDDHLNGYISKEGKAFTCSCGQKVAAPSYKTCDCGKVWNVYAIGDTHHLASDSADMFIAREIEVRPGVIMANRKTAKDGECTCWEGYERVPGTEPCASKSCRKKSSRLYRENLAMIDKLADWTKYDDDVDPTVEAYGKPKIPSTKAPKIPRDWSKRQPDGKWKNTNFAPKKK